MIKSTLRFDDVRVVSDLLPLLWVLQRSPMWSRKRSGRWWLGRPISELLPDVFNILLQGGLVVSGSLPLVRDTNVRTAAHLLVTICVSYNLYTQLYSFTGLIPRIHEVWEWDGSTYYIVLYNCFLVGRWACSDSVLLYGLHRAHKSSSEWWALMWSHEALRLGLHSTM